MPTKPNAIEPKQLSAEDILAWEDLVDESVFVPEWGGTVKVRGLTRAQVYQMQKDATVGKNTDAQRADMLLLVMGIIEPKFTEDQGAALMQKSAGATQRILDAIMRLSGMGGDAAAAADRSFPS